MTNIKEQELRDEWKQDFDLDNFTKDDDKYACIANWWLAKRSQLLQEIEERVPKIYCGLNKKRDDGVHIDYKCLECGNEWGEELPTPLCGNPKIRLVDLRGIINSLK